MKKNRSLYGLFCIISELIKKTGKPLENQMCIRDRALTVQETGRDTIWAATRSSRLKKALTAMFLTQAA